MLPVELVERYGLMQRYVGWCADDAARVAGLGPLVMPHAAELIADFYAEIRRHAQAAAVIRGGSEQIKRLSQSLRQWLVELLAGVYDDAYLARRWRVGLRHVEIGLAQRFTSLALSRLRSGIVRCVLDEWRGTPVELQNSLESLHKLIDLEHALIQDAYEFEHVRRERELEKARGERRFRRLVESASCLIVILRADHSVTYFNPFAERVTGYSTADLASAPADVLAVLGSTRDDVAGRLESVLVTAERITYEEACARREGPPRWISWTLSRIDEFDDGPVVLAVGHDVTDQRQAAQELLQASRLATIGEMYARLAHESRNALQRMGVCMEMLADHVAEQPPAAALLQRAQHAQDDLRRLLDEVRNFSAPMTLERTECRLSVLWREAWNLMQATRADRKARLNDECRMADALDADRFRLVQMFRNIFENALAACPDPVEITVHCRETTLNDFPAIKITIDDNGPGFVAEARQRAFEPFFTTKSEGTGLGLAIVQRVVEAHAGRVSASAAPNGGARLCIELPRRPERV
jgi:two-component system sensor kinase FixL